MFSKEELEEILLLSKGSTTSNDTIKSIIKKVETELYVDHNFIKYI